MGHIFLLVLLVSWLQYLCKDAKTKFEMYAVTSNKIIPIVPCGFTFVF